MSGGVDLLLLPHWMKPELFAFADRHSAGGARQSASLVGKSGMQTRTENKTQFILRYVFIWAFTHIHTRILIFVGLQIEFLKCAGSLSPLALGGGLTVPLTQLPPWTE